jgi:hypothetical protein
MFDKEQVKAAVEAVNEAGGDSEALKLWGHMKGCKAPFKIIYIILSNCTTVNNGACPDWDFCEPIFQVNKK